MSATTEERWQKAFKVVREQFEIDDLLPELENARREFLGGRNIFVNFPTGYGKSLIFQCLPIAADALFGKPRGSSVLVVISPLRSLMEGQIRNLNNMGVPAIAITDDEDVEIIQQVMNGNYMFLLMALQSACSLGDVLCRGRTGDEVMIRAKPQSDPSQTIFDVGASWSSLSSSPDRLTVSEYSLVLRLLRSGSNFSVCSISDRRFFSFATQFRQTYLFSIDRKDISNLSISVSTSNCFHPFESNTLSFPFSMTRQHKLQNRTNQT